MPLNLLSTVNAFTPNDPAEIQARKTQQAMTQVQAGEAMRAIQNRNALSDIMRTNSDPIVAADLYQKQTGDFQTAQGLRDTKQKNDLSAIATKTAALKYAISSAKLATPENWGAWRDSLIKGGVLGVEGVPKTYDKKFLDELTTDAKAKLSSFNLLLPGGKQKQIVTLGNKITYEGPPVDRFKPDNTETWGPAFEMNGGLYQISSRKKVHPIDKGSKPSAAEQKRDAAVQYLMTKGAPEDKAKEIADGMRTGMIRDNGMGGLAYPDGTPVEMTWPKKPSGRQPGDVIEARIVGGATPKPSAPAASALPAASAVPTDSAFPAVPRPVGDQAPTLGQGDVTALNWQGTGPIPENVQLAPYRLVLAKMDSRALETMLPAATRKALEVVKQNDPAAYRRGLEQAALQVIATKKRGN